MFRISQQWKSSGRKGTRTEDFVFPFLGFSQCHQICTFAPCECGSVTPGLRISYAGKLSREYQTDLGLLLSVLPNKDIKVEKNDQILLLLILKRKVNLKTEKQCINLHTHKSN